MTAATVLIREFQDDKRFKATCPICMEDFALSDAVLFALDHEPPPTALAPPSRRCGHASRSARQSSERAGSGIRSMSGHVNSASTVLSLLTLSLTLF